MSDTSLPKVLIVAANVSARFGGEAILPLHYFRLLSARGWPVQLVAHHRNRDELLALADCDPARMHFVPDTRWHKFFWRLFSRCPERIRDLIGGGVLGLVNEVYQARIIARLVAAGEVDLIHQPTPVSPLTPSGLHRFGVPLVIGPMNGGMDYPPGYEDMEGRGTRFAIRWGRRVAQVMNRLTPGKHRAARLLVANERTRNALPDPTRPGIEVLVENGIDFALWAPKPRELGAAAIVGRLRLVFMGRLIALKGVDLTLRAIALARAGGADVSLDVLGDGDQRAALETLAAELDLSDCVTFHGFLPQAACAEVLARADALVLGSLRECGGAVVLEAMAMGLPVVASAWGGPQDYLTAQCGILMSPAPRDSFVTRQAEAFVTLANAPDLRLRMGEAGAIIARRDFDWQRKIDDMTRIYRDVLAQG